jgi:LysR family transcriptional regulator for bpeEF and oprC
MDRLQAMKVFTRVVETSNFTRAADSLDLPRASVSIIIQRLEAHLKVRLLQRTTRRVSLTTDGAAYYERCVRILADVEETESSFASVARTPRGRLRIDMPVALGRSIVRAHIHNFHTRYPDIDLLLGFSNAPADPVQDGVDCAIRTGKLTDSSLVARRIGEYQSITCASPGYLERFGMPEIIGDLGQHVAVNYFSGHAGRIANLTFHVDNEAVSVRMKGGIAVNDADAYVESALEGIGLIQAPRFMTHPHLSSGRLVEILPAHRPLPTPVYATYPNNRHLLPTVRVLVDWLAALLGETSLLGERAATPLRELLASPVNHDMDDEARHADEALM